MNKNPQWAQRLGATSDKDLEKYKIITRWESEGEHLRVDLPDFIATDWVFDKEKNQFFSECYEYEGDRWEGFVALKTPKG